MLPSHLTSLGDFPGCHSSLNQKEIPLIVFIHFLTLRVWNPKQSAAPVFLNLFQKFRRKDGCGICT